jgi:hypothetical protein
LFKKVFIPLLLSLVIVSGCGPAAPITEQEYKTALAKAVCVAVEQLNQTGALNDSEKFAAEFEEAVAVAVSELGYSERQWLTAKEKYFTPEEHEKLMKLHFTWCLIGGAIVE